MADLSVTAANVIAGSNASIVHGKAGATITAGQQLYKEASSGLYKPADSNSATVEAKTASATALHGSLTGQPISVATSGDVNVGATLTAGSAYYLSETPGGIQPAADLASGENVCQIGLAKSATILTLRYTAPGVTL